MCFLYKNFKWNNYSQVDFYGSRKLTDFNLYRFLITIYLDIPISDLAILNERWKTNLCFSCDYLTIVRDKILLSELNYTINWITYDNPEQFSSWCLSQWYAREGKTVLTKKGWLPWTLILDYFISCHYYSWWIWQYMNNGGMETHHLRLLGV